MIVFDLETDGLLHELTKIHCITAIDRTTGRHYAFNDGQYADGSFAQHDGTIEDGLEFLAEASQLAGHNIIFFDIPAIQKLYPDWKPKAQRYPDIVDTQVCARVIWTNIFDIDVRASARGKRPEGFNRHMGKHSLKAWGLRLGVLKGDFDGPWSDFTPEMDKYARQDPVVTLALLEQIEGQKYSEECLALEHRVAQIIFRQIEHGFAFDMQAAEALTAKLQKRHAEIVSELAELFPPWYGPKITKGTAEFTPKRDNKKEGYVAGAPFSRIKLNVFNPGSRDHISNRLMARHGWKPKEFTDNGKPKIDETVLGALTYPEAKVLSEYLMLEKRLGQVATGDEAWLRHATRTGLYGREAGGVWRIHGGVNPNGAVTGRMTHSSPNIAQVPANHAPFGEDCRSCFIATPGYTLVGCDAEGLELRMLAHFMAMWDDGAYAETVVNGRKEDESDVHNVNKRAAGLNSRDSAKTFIYALIYGAGDYKLGCIVYDDFTDEQRGKFNAKHRTKRQRQRAFTKLGKARRARIMEGLPALGKLAEKVKQRAKRGYLKGLDGRKLHVRSEHAALNTLLQSAGALVMKRALVLFDDEVAANATYRDSVHYCANVHDEVQLDVKPHIAEEIGQLFAGCISKAGEHFGIRCPLAGSYALGACWKETH